MVSPPDRGNAELLRCGYKREIFDLKYLCYIFGGHRFGFRSISAAAKNDTKGEKLMFYLPERQIYKENLNF